MWRRTSGFVSGRRFQQAGDRFALRGATALAALLFAGCFGVSALGGCRRTNAAKANYDSPAERSP